MKKIPEHIAIIMDGNGRWAQGQNRPRHYGHQIGAENILKVAKYCNELGVKYLTLYAFSTENWNRPQKEVDFLIKDLPFLIYNKFKSKLKDNDMRMSIAGRTKNIPHSTLELFHELEESSQKNQGLHIVLAYNYGGKAEIIDACQKIIDAHLGKETYSINEEIFREYLYLPEIPDVDLLIRPGGEFRLSNFLLWQSAYAELYFSQKFWPDYGKDDIDLAIDFYDKRKRKFGRVPS